MREKPLSDTQLEVLPSHSRPQQRQPDVESKGSRFHVLPVVDTITGRTLRLNLVRTTHTKLSEGSGWVSDELYDACVLGKSCEEKNAEHAVVSLTCGPDDLHSPTFLEGVHSALCATQLAPKQLELAFDEVTLFKLLRQTPGHFAMLKRWGVKLAVRDFGAHTSSLACLESPLVESVVLSPTLVQQLTASLKSPHYPLAVIRAVVEAAQCLELSVVASGIRTFDQCRMLQSLGCVLQQGEFFRQVETTGYVGLRLEPLQSETQVTLLQRAVN